MGDFDFLKITHFEWVSPSTASISILTKDEDGESIILTGIVEIFLDELEE